MKRSMQSILMGAALAMLMTSMPGLVWAQAEDNPATELAKQPAVRHRLLLVKGRFELSPTFEATINADYRHTIGAGLKVEYHLSDMFSAGAVAVFGTSFNTGLSSKIFDTLRPLGDPADTDEDPEPNQAEFEQHLNNIPLHGAVYASVTPWYGKLAAFGKAFVNFDFYFQGGIAIAQLSSSCANTVCDDPAPGVLDPAAGLTPDDNPNNDPPLNDGTKLGIYLGGGIHVFVNNWIAIDLTVRDYVFSDNPSGLDFDADLAVTSDDTRFLNHLFVGIGASFFFPAKVKRTE